MSHIMSRPPCPLPRPLQTGIPETLPAHTLDSPNPRTLFSYSVPPGSTFIFRETSREDNSDQQSAEPQSVTTPPKVDKVDSAVVKGDGKFEQTHDVPPDCSFQGSASPASDVSESPLLKFSRAQKQKAKTIQKLRCQCLCISLMMFVCLVVILALCAAILERIQASG